MNELDTNSAYLVGTSHYSFRRNEPALIKGLEWVTPVGLEKRLAYKVMYDDGFIDYVPISDTSYEIIQLPTKPTPVHLDSIWTRNGKKYLVTWYAWRVVGDKKELGVIFHYKGAPKGFERKLYLDVKQFIIEYEPYQEEE